MGKYILKYLFLFLSFIDGYNLFAQPTDLIFTEYIEGASNDKCVEIYNGTGAAISLNGYSVRIYSNGSSTVTTTIALPNITLNNCDAYVVCHSSAQASLLAIDDLSTASLNFNGDDAVELFDGSAMVDLIGNIGCDPGTEWTGVGNGTADDILRRQAAYCSNVASDEVGNCPWSAFTAGNWSSTGNTTDFSDLGSHTSTCASCGPSNTITTGVIAGSPFAVTCVAPAAVNVPFTSSGTFNVGNIYTAQLSDASGSFAIPVNIGTLSSTANSGTITASIPAGTSAGTLYRIRVVSDNPSVIGTDNGVDLTITGIIAGTMMVNEVSNGASGSKEYMEFVVLGTPCTSVSIQNIIFDDNNGDFGAATGVASGHYRFTTSSQWGCVPTGSIIVVYNDADLNASLPAVDESDGNVDSVYVLPITSAFLEMCTTVPNTAGPTTTYTGCTYVAPTTWNPLGLANSGDACQLRYSNGTYMHGIGFGGATGGPDNILLAGGAGNNFYFSNGVDDDYTDVNNFSAGTAPTNETPGAANNVANQAFINRFRCVGLAVDWIDLSATSIENTVRLDWSTQAETNSDYFTIERADDNFQFIPIGKVAASGTTQWVSNYSFYDANPLNSVSYYRIKETAFDGTVQYSQVKAIFRGEKADEPWFNGQVVNLSACDENAVVRIFDASGKLISEEKITDGFYQPSELTSGFYFIHVICNRSEFTFKFSVTR